MEIDKLYKEHNFIGWTDVMPQIAIIVTKLDLNLETFITL